MSHTNSTPNYSLPQFLPTDKPFWLTDINGAFSAIDSAIDAAKDAADNAQSDATQALTDAGNASTAASTADGKGSGAVASIADTFDPTSTYSVGDYVMYNNLLYVCTTAVTTPGAWNAGSWSRTTVESILANKADTSGLAAVALSGDYDDLSDKPIDYKSNSWANYLRSSISSRRYFEVSINQGQAPLYARVYFFGDSTIQAEIFKNGTFDYKVDASGTLDTGITMPGTGDSIKFMRINVDTNAQLYVEVVNSAGSIRIKSFM